MLQELMSFLEAKCIYTIPVPPKNTNLYGEKDDLLVTHYQIWLRKPHFTAGA